MCLIKKFVPYDVYIDIYKIDYNKLYSDGRRIILFDLDNTIISYDEDIPSDKMIALFKKIREIGFQIIIMSNNHSKRIELASNTLDVFGIPNAMKPLSKGYRIVLKKYDINKNNKNQVIAIGDQILTDVMGASNMHIDTILVNAISRKSEKWYTKFNRNTENFIIKMMKKNYQDIYMKIKECRGIISGE